jgi:hypothetical protein
MKRKFLIKQSETLAKYFKTHFYTKQNLVFQFVPHTVIYFLPKLCISITDSQQAKFRYCFGMILTISKLCSEIFT